MKPFDALVTNAFDFLTKSVEEVETDPKYSIIHFAVALELLLKARLVHEHWTLILVDPAKADRSSFQDGRFQSVSVGTAIERVENILGDQLSTRQKRVFGQLRDHRNRLVHAFHPEFGGSGGPEVIQRAVAEQALGWYYLSQLLRGEWSEVFAGYKTRAEDFENVIKDKGHFLQGKYEDLKEAIERQNAEGVEFRDCAVCGYESAREKAVVEELINLKCLVCGDARAALRLQCASCSGTVLFEDLKGGCKTEGCHQVVDIDAVTEMFSTIYDKDDLLDGLPAICHWCEHVPESVVAWGEGYLCLSCLELHETLGHCGYCNQAMTGNWEGSYAFGCVFCGGSIGADRS